MRDVDAPIGDRKSSFDREVLVAGLLNLSGLLWGGFTLSGEGGRRFGARRIGCMGAIVVSTGRGGNCMQSCDEGGDGSADGKGAGFCKGEEGEAVLLSTGTSSGSYVP